MPKDVLYVGVKFPSADVLSQSQFKTKSGAIKRKVHVLWNEVSQEEARKISSTVNENLTGILSYTYNTDTVQFMASPRATLQYTHAPETKVNVSATFEEC